MFIIFMVGIYLFASFLALFVSKKTKVPVLIFFLGLGLFTNISDSYMDNLELIETISSLALAIILFTGAMDTPFSMFKKVWKPSLSLATLGILLSSVLTGVIVYCFLGFGILESILCGAVVTSTDAASIFMIFSHSKKPVKENVRGILEVESGCNDPMAFGIITLLISMLVMPNVSFIDNMLNFGWTIISGVTLGLFLGYLVSYILKKFRAPTVQSIVILLIATVFICFGVSFLIGANVFLAIYLCGIIIGNSGFTLRTFSIHFFDTFSWVMQIMLFILLGLIVSPAEVLSVFWIGLPLSLISVFVIRPATVFASLFFIRGKVREKLFISWAGLKGAVPIVFAIFVKQADVAHSDIIFNLAFFIVVISVLIQGTTLEWMATKLGVIEPESENSQSVSLNELETIEDLVNKVTVKESLDGKTLAQTSLYNDYVVVSIKRDGEFIVPNASTALNKNDELILVEKT